MRLRLFQIDAFASDVFTGNPAAVCPLESWLDPEQMQSIAQENNLSETAFFVPTANGYDLRWFTPTTEVELCGHATLASAYVIFNCIGTSNKQICFNTRSGPLTVGKERGLFRMDFPVRRAHPVVAPHPYLLEGLGRSPESVLAYGEAEQSGYYLAVFRNEDEVRELKPDLPLLTELTGMMVIATAPGHQVDFVSRCFAPGFGVDEDPVTGSAHCVLTPYWCERLNKPSLRAHQVSARGGEVFCQLLGDRVALSGNAVCYLEGTIEI